MDGGQGAQRHSEWLWWWAKRDRLLEELLTYRRLHATLERESARRKELPYWLLSLRYGKLVTRAELAWCGEALRYFSEDLV